LEQLSGYEIIEDVIFNQNNKERTTNTANLEKNIQDANSFITYGNDIRINVFKR
jgi:hypothetical protein